jgi:hypothetical protein
MSTIFAAVSDKGMGMKIHIIIGMGIGICIGIGTGIGMGFGICIGIGKGPSNYKLCQCDAVESSLCMSALISSCRVSYVDDCYCCF